MNDTIALPVRDWASSVNSTIQLLKMAYDAEDVAAALLGTVSLYNLADGDVLTQAPEELRVPLQRWWDGPVSVDDTSLDDVAAKTRRLHNDWEAVYPHWQIQQRQEIA